MSEKLAQKPPPAKELITDLRRRAFQLDLESDLGEYERMAGALISDLLKAIASVPSPATETWEPIETLPADDDIRLILLGRRGESRVWFGTAMSRGNATHWMPLPAPPSEPPTP